MSAVEELRAHRCGCGGPCGQQTPAYIAEAAAALEAAAYDYLEAPDAVDWKARVTALENVLEPFAKLGDIILAEAPPEARTVLAFTSETGEKFTMKLDYFRAARAALSPKLGEEKR